MELELYFVLFLPRSQLVSVSDLYFTVHLNVIYNTRIITGTAVQVLQGRKKRAKTGSPVLKVTSLTKQKIKQNC